MRASTAITSWRARSARRSCASCAAKRGSSAHRARINCAFAWVGCERRAAPSSACRIEFSSASKARRALGRVSMRSLAEVPARRASGNRLDARRARTALRTRVALYAAAATVLFVVERWLPNPVPWVRLGLANVVTLVVLLEHGFTAAGCVVLLRLVLGSFFAASLFGPQFVLSASGATASWLAMGGAARFGRRWLSPLG